MAQKRRSKRVIKRLEVTFSVSGLTYTGITSDVSKEGIFIRTKKGLRPGTIVEVELYLPSGEKLKMRGVVKRTIKTNFQQIKNGMGIEIMDPPPQYTEFARSLE